MVRYIFVAGVYAVAVLAAPAQNAAEVAAAPAGWGDNSPSLGSALFGWARPNHNKPDADEQEAGPSSLYAPSASRGWGDLFGAGRGDRGSKGGSGAGSSASQPPRDWGSVFGGGRGGSGSDSSAPPKTSSGGSWLSGMFGGSRPKPASSSSGSSSSSPWWRPKPESTKPKPEWNPKPEDSAWPKTPEPKPAGSESSDEAEATKPEPAQPKPQSAAPVPTPQAKPEPAQPKPESAAPVPEPTPLEPKPEPEAAKPVPTPTAAEPKPKPIESAPEEVEVPLDTSEWACGAKPRQRYSGDIESVRKQLWQPNVSAKWQIILDGVPDTKQANLKPVDAHIWDIDAWDAADTNICDLKKQKKKVICYFSAGTSETWRDDNAALKPFNLGVVGMTDDPKGKVWEGEEWVDIREPKVREVMKSRIKMAAMKGCDAIDPDNIDGYDNVIQKAGKKTNLSKNDAVKYVKFLADEAARYGMSIGLKNSLTIIPEVKSYIQFAVNEECAKVKECQEYKELLAVKKPVFHIEYTGTSGQTHATTRTTYKDPNAATKKYCNPLREAVSRFSTIIKAGETIGNQYLYCDGRPADFTQMSKWIDKGSKGKGNFVKSQDDESSEVDVNEKFTNGTMIAEEQSSNSTMVTTWKVKKRRHGRRAVLVDVV